MWVWKEKRIEGLFEELENMYSYQAPVLQYITELKNITMDRLTELKKQIINYGEYFLMDILGNDLTIVKLTKKTYKTPSGRVVHCKIIETIIEDCREVYGTPMNGYWVVPKLEG